MDWFSQINDTVPFDWTDTKHKTPDGPPAWSLRRDPKSRRPQQAQDPVATAPQPEQLRPDASAAPQSSDWFSELNGAAASQPQSVAPEAPQESWGQWIKNSVKGRQDPREAGTGTVFDQFRAELGNPTANAAIFGADDAGMGDIIQKSLGERFIRREKDANGYEVMVTRGQDGQEQRGYVNKPGLDLQDVSRAVYGSLPYIGTGGAAGAALKTSGVGVNALAQAGAAAVTSVGGDIGSGIQGSEQGVDPVKAGTMAAFGAAGPVAGVAAGALWRKFVTIPGLIDKSTGQLTARGIEAAKRAGIDPADITPDFAKSFANTLAKTGDEVQAATQAGVDRFGIPATRGQVTKDPYLLTQEEGMRRRLFGESAQDTMRAFDASQQDAIRFAAFGGDGAGRNTFAPKQGIGEQINPARMPGSNVYDRMPGTLGESIQQGLQSARKGAKSLEREAWKGADDLAVTPEALATLPGTLNAKLGGLVMSDANTPAAAQMAKHVEGILTGEAPQTVAGWVKASPTKNVDQMRRNLLAMSKSAQSSTDKAAAKAIYDGFNDWISDAAKANLLKGDPAAAMKLVNARGFTKEVREIFSPTNEAGRATPASRRLAKVLDEGMTDSGESVIQALFGAQGSRSVNEGTVSSMQSIKSALEKYAPPEHATQAWNDIRLAYWTRLVTNKGGDIVGPTAMLSNLKTAFNSQKTVMNVLFTGAEQRQMREFVRALEVVSYKPPNASGSGYSAAQFAKEGLLRFLDAFGLGKIGSAALQYTGFGNALNYAAAKQATRQIARPVRPNVTPAITSAGHALYDGQRGGGR